MRRCERLDVSRPRDPGPVKRASRYDKQPSVAVPGSHQVWTGAEAWREVDRHASDGGRRAPLVVVDTYPGVDLVELTAGLRAALPHYVVINVEDAAAKPIREIDALIASNLTDDRVFGVISHHDLREFYDADRLAGIADRVLDCEHAHGADRLGRRPGADPPLDVSCSPTSPGGRSSSASDAAHRTGGATTATRTTSARSSAASSSSGGSPTGTSASCSPRWTSCSTRTARRPTGTLITAETFRAGMAAAVSSPFRVVPFFDPGVWGGQWMKQVLWARRRRTENYAWCFDCVPEENSLLLDVAGELVELPSIDVVFTQPRELLGELTFARFGAEFPIRFDFLDTMQGGNLSLQVHPLTDYIHDTFGMHYTQDESYYLLDAADDAVVYLGLKTGIDPDAMVTSLAVGLPGRAELPRRGVRQHLPGAASTTTSRSRPARCTAPAPTRWCWRSRPLPTSSPSRCGTGIASGSTACPAPSTWTMPDATSSGTATRPGPGTTWSVRWRRWAAGPGWVEERTGLHELEFIEVRRHWFTDVVEHDTAGTVHVLNLVEGAEAVVESPTGTLRAVRRALRRDLHRSRPGRPLPYPPARRRRRPTGWPRSRPSYAVRTSVPLVDRPEGGAQQGGDPGCARPDGPPATQDRTRLRTAPPDRRLDDVPRAGHRSRR